MLVVVSLPEGTRNSKDIAEHLFAKLRVGQAAILCNGNLLCRISRDEYILVKYTTGVSSSLSIEKWLLLAQDYARKAKGLSCARGAFLRSVPTNILNAGTLARSNDLRSTSYIVVISDRKNNNYFDLEFVPNGITSSVFYNRRYGGTKNKVAHSGDQHLSNLLVHVLTIPHDECGSVVITGFRNKHLHEFAVQNPILFLVTPSVSGLVIFPLRKEIMGTSTKAVVMHFSEDKIHLFDTLPSVSTVEDTGIVGRDTMAMLKQSYHKLPKTVTETSVVSAAGIRASGGAGGKTDGGAGGKTTGGDDSPQLPFSIDGMEQKPVNVEQLAQWLFENAKDAGPQSFSEYSVHKQQLPIAEGMMKLPMNYAVSNGLAPVARGGNYLFEPVPIVDLPKLLINSAHLVTIDIGEQDIRSADLSCMRLFGPLVTIVYLHNGVRYMLYDPLHNVEPHSELSLDYEVDTILVPEEYSILDASKLALFDNSGSIIGDLNAFVSHCIESENFESLNQLIQQLSCFSDVATASFKAKVESMLKEKLDSIHLSGPVGAITGNEFSVLDLKLMLSSLKAQKNDIRKCLVSLLQVSRQAMSTLSGADYQSALRKDAIQGKLANMKKLTQSDLEEKIPDGVLVLLKIRGDELEVEWHCRIGPVNMGDIIGLFDPKAFGTDNQFTLITENLFGFDSDDFDGSKAYCLYLPFNESEISDYLGFSKESSIFMLIANTIKTIMPSFNPADKIATFTISKFYLSLAQSAKDPVVIRQMTDMALACASRGTAPSFQCWELSKGYLSKPLTSNLDFELSNMLLQLSDSLEFGSNVKSGMSVCLGTELFNFVNRSVMGMTVYSHLNIESSKSEDDLKLKLRKMYEAVLHVVVVLIRSTADESVETVKSRLSEIANTGLLTDLPNSEIAVLLNFLCNHGDLRVENTATEDAAENTAAEDAAENTAAEDAAENTATEDATEKDDEKPVESQRLVNAKKNLKDFWTCSFAPKGTKIGSTWLSVPNLRKLGLHEFYIIAFYSSMRKHCNENSYFHYGVPTPIGKKDVQKAYAIELKNRVSEWYESICGSTGGSEEEKSIEVDSDSVASHVDVELEEDETGICVSAVKNWNLEDKEPELYSLARFADGCSESISPKPEMIAILAKYRTLLEVTGLNAKSVLTLLFPNLKTLGEAKNAFRNAIV